MLSALRGGTVLLAGIAAFQSATLSASAIKVGERYTYRNRETVLIRSKSIKLGKEPLSDQTGLVTTVVLSSKGPVILEYAEPAAKGAALSRSADAARHLQIIHYGAHAAGHTDCSDLIPVGMPYPNAALLRKGAIGSLDVIDMPDDMKTRVESISMIRLDGILCRLVTRRAESPRRAADEGVKIVSYVDRTWIEQAGGVLRRFESSATGDAGDETLTMIQHLDLKSRDRVSRQRVARLRNEAETLLALEAKLPRSTASAAEVDHEAAALDSWKKRHPRSPFMPIAEGYEDSVMGVRGVMERRKAHDTRQASLLNHPAPEFALKDLDGAEHMLKGYRGKTILLNFFASW